jgi:branched-chain amino acid transport system ATP-binding protein
MLNAKGIVAGYLPGVNILDGIDFSAKSGSITAIIGANGAGKSTFLKVLYGFLPLQAGEVFFQEKSINKKTPEHLVRMGISFVPQQTKSLFPDMTVEENLELGCWIIRKEKQKMRKAIEKVYQNHRFLAEARLVPAGLLSGGQQRILELERAMLLNPRLILLDEPTATLSPVVSDSIYDLLLVLKQRGTTIVLVDQNVVKAFEVADELYIFEMGKTKAYGSKANMQEQMRGIVESWIALDECAG